jgi:DNA replication protein DnaC
VPARPYKPRDKAKAEVAVQIAQRWILARLRNETFFSPEALNRRIAELRDELNLRPLKKLGGKTRRELFESLDRPHLKALPETRYVLTTWENVTVNLDYHVEFEKHWYSAPYVLVHLELEARVTATTVELLHRGNRVASHARSFVPYKHTTDDSHMPEAHRRHSAGVEGVLAWGASVGPMTEAMVRRLIDAKAQRAASAHHGGDVAYTGQEPKARKPRLRRAIRPARRRRVPSTRQPTTRQALSDAQFRYPQACIEDVDPSAARGIDKPMLRQIASGGWIGEHLNLTISGATGVGKSYLGCAAGQAVCRQRRRVLYRRLPRLLDELSLARADGSYARTLSRLAKTEVLILDDLGLGRIGEAQRHDLLEVLEDRYGCASTIVTSQLPVDKWHEWIGDPSIADAILDRLVHNAYKIILKGPSRRKDTPTPKPEA